MPFARDIRFDDIALAATGDIIPAVPTKRIVVIGYALVNNVATAQTIIFRSGTTDITGTLAFPSAIGGGLSYAGGPDCPAFSTAVGQPLNGLLAAATSIGGHITYMVA